MKLRIKENESSNDINSNKLFIEDKEYIEDVFSTMRTGQYYLRPLHKYNNETWKDIVADVRKIINADNNVSVENTIKEKYDDIAPDDFLYDWLRDLLDDIDYKGHDSKYEKYAETLSLLIRGETFWW